MSSDVVKKFVADKIKFYRKLSGFTQKELGEKIGVKHNTISSYESGKNEPEQDMLFKIAAALGISINDLFPPTSKSVPSTAPNTPTLAPRGVRIPVLGRVVAGIPLEAITDIIDYEEIPAQMAKSGTYFALQVKGRSMEPTLHEGDVVIVRQQPEVENGEIAIVLVNGNDATVKEVKEGPDGLTLIGHNVGVYSPHFYTREQIQDLPIRILGKVVELRRKF